MSVVDVRLVPTRDGHVRVLLEGRRVGLEPAATPSAALHELARAIDGAAWVSCRAEHDEIADASSVVYTPRSGT